MVKAVKNQPPHHVVIVGGGFGGLYAAKALSRARVKVTLIDKRNFHLFQPLLYQVATGALSPADISSPLRSVLSKSKSTKVLLGEVSDIDPQQQKIFMGGEEIRYDSLILATGAKHSYFGKDHWEEFAPGLKTVEDAIEIRHRIFMAFEAAEKETDPEKRSQWLTFIIVGAGPTGVELAGAIAELAYHTLKDDFRSIDTKETRVLLLEGLDRPLPPFAPELSREAQASLSRLGVNVKTKTLVTSIEDDIVTIKQGDEVTQIAAKTVLWAAGVNASPLGKVLAERTSAECDRAGRVMVEPDLSVKGYPNIFVIGDLAHFAHQNGKPLPGVAPVAMQQGEYVASLIKQQLRGDTKLPLFYYADRGSLAVIGQNSAVVDLGFIKFTGFVAWLFWLLIHIYFLIEFDNKLLVMIQWGWNYFTQNRRARLITGKELLQNVKADHRNKDYTPAQNIQAVM
ncbi:MAG: NAD(P)/FAD-dependent oxidoreductase [Stigonema ocellatum SAG 48.90 = DSM 106950]|nr:NAD(P)/FAD-dependent oxidoreductase [Stigonema ocellatum SAG 48.90 = DSM 106950]